MSFSTFSDGNLHLQRCRICIGIIGDCVNRLTYCLFAEN